jgi:hypothetical protein
MENPSLEWEPLGRVTGEVLASVLTGDRYVLTLVARKSAIPAEVRMRRLLKFALRSLALRCISLEKK